MFFVPDLSVFHSLLEESDMNSFPDNDLLRHLRVVTQDAERCSSVAQQLLNGKRQTRYTGAHRLVKDPSTNPF